MLRKLSISFASLFLIPLLLMAQDGKLRGKVTDKETGEPLIGANIQIEGTSLGGSTDVNGDYIVLSVPAGAFTVKASYVGYSPFTIENVRVNAGLTTTQDIKMSSTSVQAQPVVVVAERPLIQRNTTNTVRITTQDQIQNLPVRGVQNLVALDAGVVQQGGALYMRGGRAGEVSYQIDGANVTNPNGAYENITVVQEAIEEIQVHTGGMTAEYGGANSGIIQTTTRTGGSQFHLTADYLTDDFAKPGKTFLGTTSNGYKRAAATISGPIIPGIRFFGVGNLNYNQNNQYMFLEPFRFDSLVTDAHGARPAGQLLPNGGTIEYKRNYLYQNWNQNWVGQGNILFDFEQLAGVPMKLKVDGYYSDNLNPVGGGWPGVGNYFRVARDEYSHTQSYFGNLKLTHLLSATTYYDLGVSFQGHSNVTYDPAFGDNWKAYPDSVANFKAGFVDTSDHSGYGWTRYNGPQGYSTIYAFGFANPKAPNNSYSKDKQTNIAATVDFTSQVNTNWELKAGGSIEQWTLRRWSIGNISNYLNFIDPGHTGTPLPDTTLYSSDMAKGIPIDRARRARLAAVGGMTWVGYNVDGVEGNGYTLSDGTAPVDKPYQPVFASAYVQNKFEYKDLIVNAGLRYEYIAPKTKKIEPTLNPLTGQYDYQTIAGVDPNLGLINEKYIETTDPYSLVLPRISFSFPVSEKTVFYLQYGKYAQLYNLGQLYPSDMGFSNGIAQGQRSPFGGPGNAIGFMARPERTTQFETGIREFLSTNLAMTMTGFYKDQRDQLQWRRVYNSSGTAIFNAYQNTDFATTKGLEFTLELRRTERLSARFNYTFSDAEGTGASSASNSVATSDETKAIFPNFITPLPFNQTHRGSLMLDYRFAKGDGGPILEGMGLNLIMTFNSGHNYTKIAEPQNLGQANAWNIGVRALLDARFRNPVEPVNASTTPWIFNIDAAWNKVFYTDYFNFELYVNVLNLLNTKEVLNVYPTTGSATDDGWFKSPFSSSYQAIPLYTDFYRALNLQNRWGLMQTFVGDTYGIPRQIRVGAKFEF